MYSRAFSVLSRRTTSARIALRLAAVRTQEKEINPGVVDGLSIVLYPHPSLRAKNVPIDTTDKDALADAAQTAARLFALMYAAEGVGLAAPQVGINQRLMVFNPTGDEKKWMDQVVLINPVVTATSTATEIGEEGCLSFPEMSGQVERYKWIKVEYTEPKKGRVLKKKYTGWEARIFQHEYDHLDGKVYIDHIVEKEDEMTERLEELVSEFGDGGVL